MNLLPCIKPDSALFLDFDGTLAELAPSPGAVRLAPELIPTLWALAERLRGAVAIVTGRPIDEVDGFLHPLKLPTAGVHGAQRRSHQNCLTAPTPPPLERGGAVAEAGALRHSGLLVERKPMAVALHYRLAPELEALCEDGLAAALAASSGLEMMRGKMVFEVKPAGVSKGRAIEAFMRESPFAGRVPLFVGDDVTDEAGFEAVLRLGGQGIKVGEGESLAQHRIADPATLRVWLQAAVIRLPQAEPLPPPLLVPAVPAVPAEGAA